MFRHCLTAGVVCAFGGVLLAPLQAQDPETPPNDAVVSSSTFTPTLYAPLTLAQKYLYSVNQVFSPGSMFLYGLHAGIDQWRDLPHQWGSGEESYAVRTASFFGRSFLRQNIAFGVRAFDHEDPRYFPLAHGSHWTRVKYAIVRTFLVQNDLGGIMPAYSLVASAYMTPFFADKWRPDHFDDTHPLRVGSGSIGIAVGSNVFREFWPDIRKKLDVESRLHHHAGH